MRNIPKRPQLPSNASSSNELTNPHLAARKRAQHSSLIDIWNTDIIQQNIITHISQESLGCAAATLHCMTSVSQDLVARPLVHFGMALKLILDQPKIRSIWRERNPKYSSYKQSREYKIGIGPGIDRIHPLPSTEAIIKGVLRESFGEKIISNEHTTAFLKILKSDTAAATSQAILEAPIEVQRLCRVLRLLIRDLMIASTSSNHVKESERSSLQRCYERLGGDDGLRSVLVRYRQFFKGYTQYLAGFKLINVDLSGLKFYEVDFSQTILSNVIFRGATLIRCSFNNVQMSQVDFDNSLLREQSFSNSSMDSSISFENARLPDCYFRDLCLDQVRFRSADLTETRAYNVMLSSCDFSHAILIGMAFTKSKPRFWKTITQFFYLMNPNAAEKMFTYRLDDFKRPISDRQNQNIAIPPHMLLGDDHDDINTCQFAGANLSGAWANFDFSPV